MNLYGLSKLKLGRLNCNKGSITSDGIGHLELNLIKNGEINTEGIFVIKYPYDSNIKLNRSGIIFKKRLKLTDNS